MRRCPAPLLLAAVAAVACSAQPAVVAPSEAPAPTISPAAEPTLTPTPTVSGAVAPTLTPALESIAAPASPSRRGCHFRGLLPDATCTPGSLNPAVTQAAIHQTICVSGYTATIRPSVSESNRLKRLTAAAYGFTDSISNYEGDHLIALELGGAPDDIANFWDESHATSPAKDDLENDLNRAVCSGRIALAAAQQALASNWVGAYCAARLPRCGDGVHFT
jgi:hypothetical protein